MPTFRERRIADLHAGEAKTDARDAYIIAEAACSMPHTLRSLKLADKEVADVRAARRAVGGSSALYVGGTALKRWRRSLVKTVIETEGFDAHVNEAWYFDYGK